MSCNKPPNKDWICSRQEGHDGPCAVRPRTNPKSTFYVCWTIIICVLILAVMTYNIASLYLVGK